jgi:ABC-type hemin transport system ATPase subunit
MKTCFSALAALFATACDGHMETQRQAMRSIIVQDTALAFVFSVALIVFSYYILERYWKDHPNAS